MPRSYEINFRSSGLSSISRDLDRGAASAERLEKSYQRAAQAGERLSQGAGAAGGASAGPAGQRGAGAGPARYFMGPNQRLQQIRAQMERAKAEGDETVQQDLRILEFRAERSRRIGERRLAQGEEALSQPGLLDLFGELNGLMRDARGGNVLGAVHRLEGLRESFLIPGGLNNQQAGLVGRAGASYVPPTGGLGDFALSSPTVGGSSSALAGAASSVMELGGAAETASGGLGSVLGAAGPLAVAFVGAAAAGKLFEAELRIAGEVVRSAVRDLGALRQAGLTSGGTPADIGGLSALGLDPAGVGGQAADLRSRLSSDPYAMLAGQGVGVGYRPPRPFGSANEAGDLLRAIEGLRGMRDAEERLRTARLLGLEWALKYVSVSDRVWESLKRDAELRERLADPRATQGAADLDAELGRLDRGLQSIRDAAASPFLDDLAQGVGHLADAAQGAGAWVERWGGALREAFDILDPFLGKWDILLRGLNTALGHLGGPKPHEDEQVRATRENTAALQGLNRAIIEGFGGGPRIDFAIPPMLRGQAARAAFEQQTARLGSYRT